MPEARAPDGCSLFYERRGRGEPVLLIPGLGGDGRFWTGVADRLDRACDLIIVDHRGAGRSDRPAGPYSIETIAADVLTIMDREAIPAAHMVGHSTGGAIVQTLALDAPHRVRTAVLSGTWARADARFRMLFEARARLLERGQADVYQMLTHVFGYDPAWLEDHAPELDAAVAGADQALHPLAVAAARVRMLLDFDRADELGRIRQSTLVIGATEDILIPIAHAQGLTARVAGARFQALAGAHFHPRTDPEPFAEAVRAFLAAQPAARPTNAAENQAGPA